MPNCMTDRRARNQPGFLVVVPISEHYCFIIIFIKPSKNEGRKKLKKNGEANVSSGRPTQNYCYYYIFFFLFVPRVRFLIIIIIIILILILAF